MAADDSITDLIEQGAVDDDLDEIAQALAHRRDIVKDRIVREKMASLEVEDKVRLRFDSNMRPKYLDGAEGTLSEKRITKMVIQFPVDMPHEHDPYRKWGGRGIIVPAHCVERVTP